MGLIIKNYYLAQADFMQSLVLICMSMLVNQGLTPKKISGFQKRNNLPLPETIILRPEKSSSYRTSLGFDSTIILDNKTSLTMVTNHIDLIMQGTGFDPIYFNLNCSKVDCRVVFMAKNLVITNSPSWPMNGLSVFGYDLASIRNTAIHVKHSPIPFFPCVH
jgi:hypothetical protein